MSNTSTKTLKDPTAKFTRPYPSSTLSMRGFIHSVFAMAAVVGGFILFQPFGLQNLASSDRLIIILTCGFITLGIMLTLQFVFPYILKDFYNETDWTGYKQLAQSLMMLVFISLGITIYLNTQNLKGLEFPASFFLTVLIGLIPTIIFVFFQESIFLNRYQVRAKEINQKLIHKGVVQGSNPLKILSFGNSNKGLNLIPNQLIMILRTNHESEFYYQHPFGIEKVQLPIESSKVREELKGHPQFKSFEDDSIININAIKRINGTARGYEIEIARVNRKIKVSNKFRKTLEQLAA